MFFKVKERRNHDPVKFEEMPFWINYYATGSGSLKQMTNLA